MGETKICPYCGEEIQVAAKKCRYCGEWLDKTAQVTDVTTRDTEVSTTNADDESAKEELLNEMGFSNGSETAGLLWGCGWRLAVAALVIWFVCANVPEYKDHDEAIHEEARDLIRDNFGDAVDLFIPGLGTLLSTFADSKEVDKSLDDIFDGKNSIKVEEGWFWSTGYVVNESYPKGTLASFGICGIVIPLVTWDDIRILSDKEKSNFVNGKDESDDEETSTSSSDTEDYEEPDDAGESSAQITDWSMINPVTLGSDKAFSNWCDNHADWSHQTASGDIDGYAISVDISHNGERIVGRYYNDANGSMALDLNGTSVGETMYLQLGHGSQVSHAVLRKVKNTAHTWRGTWGKSEKSMTLTFSD